MSINKNGIITVNSLDENITLSDGSKWVEIVCHNIKNGKNLFLSSDDFTKLVYHNSECWCDFTLIDKISRPSTSYEFMVIQQVDNSNSFSTYRWSQTVSPLTATWSQVNPSSENITHYDGVTTYGGMYILKNNVYMCFANSTNGNWFGCGAYKLWGGSASDDTGYIPGYDGMQIYGWQKVYMRVSDKNSSISANIINANNFYEI